MEEADISTVLQHFILTRFNLLLWNKDKEGEKVRTKEWLEHRFLMFEKYCLPSIKSQMCQRFEWIVLFDSSTPEQFNDRIEDYKQECQQFTPVFVKPENGRFFAEVFRREVVKRLKACKVITTYLDNDDALNMRFVEDLQRRALELSAGTFVNYNDGYQYYSDDGYLMKIHYPTNHFVSVIENGDASTIKGIFGYGGHSYIEKIPHVRIEHVKNLPMWCEVVHEKNMANDAYFISAKMISDENLLSTDFGIHEVVNSGLRIYLFKYIPRYIKTFIRRCRYRLFGRHW